MTAERVDLLLADRRARGIHVLVVEAGACADAGLSACCGVVPVAVVVVRRGLVEDVLADYRGYLLGERGLAASTVRYYEADARLFLSQRPDPDPAGMAAGEVSRFVVVECAMRGRGSAKILVTVLRSLLRFLFVTGRIGADLTAAVPSVAGWRDTSLPHALEPGRVRALLACCDRRRVVGRRDYAILVVLVRLGLRAAEVAAMELDDIDWRAGEVLVRGKGNRDERLPLPVDVGEAVAG